MGTGETSDNDNAEYLWLVTRKKVQYSSFVHKDLMGQVFLVYLNQLQSAKLVMGTKSLFWTSQLVRYY
jgi:hypothetical protein